MYSSHKTQKELNQQLLIGLKKHLLIAQDTSAKKTDRLQSLTNLAEVLEYVTLHINEAVDESEQILLHRFFSMLLVKVKIASVAIHTQPETFNEEVAFLSILLKM